MAPSLPDHGGVPLGQVDRQVPPHRTPRGSSPCRVEEGVALEPGAPVCIPGNRVAQNEVESSLSFFLFGPARPLASVDVEEFQYLSHLLTTN